MKIRGAIGIDIGGTKTLSALFDEKLRVVAEIKTRTNATKGEKAFTEILSANTRSLTARAKERNISIIAAGAGCAGNIDQELGVINGETGLPFLVNYPLRKFLSKISGVNAVLANDVQAGLYGESKMGAAVGAKNVIAVFLGTGVGSAILLEGKLYQGSDGMAGNLGSYLLHPIDSAGESFKEGTLNSLVSRLAIAGASATLAARDQAPYLLAAAGTDISKIKSSVLARAIEKGDKNIRTLVVARARTLGFVLSNLVKFFNPELIVLGGGLVDSMPALFRAEVESGIRSNLGLQYGRLKISTTKLKSHSVTAGAAKMAIDALAMNSELTATKGHP